jgi:hypothetical protein
MGAKSGAATRTAVCLVDSMLAKHLAFAIPADVLGNSMFAFFAKHHQSLLFESQ